MASGDIDDRVGPEGELEEIMEASPKLKTYLLHAWAFKPVRTFFIPYGAGISLDGSRVYISNDLQSNVDGIECESALVRHETTEWGLRTFCEIGWDYETDTRGHRLANRAEFDHVANDLGIDLDLYRMIINPQIILEERQEFEDRAIPQDLAMYPYDEEQRRKLIFAMSSDRSAEEWEKLNAR